MKYFKLYAQCIPVKGAKNFIICDLDRSEYLFIPAELFELITSNPSGVSQKTLDNEPDDFRDELHAYLNQLIEAEIGFWTDEPESFPDLSMEWDTYEAISNAIIDYDGTVIHDYESIIKELSSLGCKDIELRFFSRIENEWLEQILEYFSGTRISSISLILEHDNYITNDYLFDLCVKNQRVFSISIHNCRHSYSGFISKEEGVNIATLNYLDYRINNETHCGVIDPDLFTVNIPTFTESIKFNSCLNRKISIDKEGKIKNCPSMPTSFGEYGYTKLSDVLNNNQFKEKWKIKKDSIAICKDCEFRYICTDCRAYLVDEKDSYSKPMKCSYNPYSGEWE